MGVPYILWLPADETFCLHAYGSPQCKHPDAGVLGEMLKNERIEPGFIKRVLSAAEAPDIASLNPHAYRAAHAHHEAERRKIEAAQQAEREAAGRRLSAFEVSRISLDDLD